MPEGLRNFSAVFVLFCGLGAAGLMVGDAYMAWRDPLTYERVHGIPVAEYVQKNHLLAIVSLAAAVIGMLRFVDQRRRTFWGSAAVVVLAASFVAATIGFIRWAVTGFDH